MAVDDAHAVVGDLLDRVLAALRAHRQEIDDLNVFPVPDGDTGTNMVRTVEAARAAVDDADRPVRAAVDGAVRGARGNSGVIFSQVLRGWFEAGLLPEPDVEAVRAACRRAHELAVGAVAEPVHGTILTVLAVVADAADAAAVDIGAAELLADLADVADEAVARTVEQLDALRRAGKVDAGGRGLAVALRAVARLVAGEAPAHDDDAGSALHEPMADVDGPGSASDREGGPGPRWEVMYVLAAGDGAVATIKEELARVGESVAVVGTGSLVRVHVHTDDIGAALEVGIAHAPPSDVRVEDLRDRACDDGTGPTDDAPRLVGATYRPAVPGAREGQLGGGPQSPVDGLGIVAVVPGPGVARLVRAHGALPLHGAAGQLPSVADVLNAVGEVGGGRVAILPGHRNVVPTAEQASRVSVMEGGRPLDVVHEADAVPAVLAALAVLTPGAQVEAAVAELRAAAGRTACAEVVAAVRDADTELGAIAAGTLLVVVDGTVRGTEHDPVAAVVAAVTAVAPEDAELVTLVAGADVNAEERSAVAEAVAAVSHLPATLEVEVLDGGQRPTRWFVGVE